jgi:hypothetical protein
MKMLAISALTVSLIFGIIILIAQDPDVTIKHGDQTVASTVCGIMYVADPKRAKRADFQLLLQRSVKVCKYKFGTATTHRNPDGTLKHAVLVEDDTCIINWELSHPAAFRAFEDVCLNKNP